jgi:hypothetical protein
VVTTPNPLLGVNMTRVKPIGPVSQDVRFRTRIWHTGLKRYLYAEDYGFRAFPIGNSKRK